MEYLPQVSYNDKPIVTQGGSLPLPAALALYSRPRAALAPAFRTLEIL
jgi:hypothetical protein